jgi:hypothetical protein
MKGQAVNALHLLRAEGKCGQRPWSRGHGLCEAQANQIRKYRGPEATVSQIMETLRVGSHSNRVPRCPRESGPHCGVLASSLMLLIFPQAWVLRGTWHAVQRVQCPP